MKFTIYMKTIYVVILLFLISNESKAFYICSYFNNLFTPGKTFELEILTIPDSAMVIIDEKDTIISPVKIMLDDYLKPYKIEVIKDSLRKTVKYKNGTANMFQLPFLPPSWMIKKDSRSVILIDKSSDDFIDHITPLFSISGVLPLINNTILNTSYGKESKIGYLGIGFGFDLRLNRNYSFSYHYYKSFGDMKSEYPNQKWFTSLSMDLRLNYIKNKFLYGIGVLYQEHFWHQLIEKKDVLNYGAGLSFALGYKFNLYNCIEVNYKPILYETVEEKFDYNHLIGLNYVLSIPLSKYFSTEIKK